MASKVLYGKFDDVSAALLMTALSAMVALVFVMFMLAVGA